MKWVLILVAALLLTGCGADSSLPTQHCESTFKTRLNDSDLMEVCEFTRDTPEGRVRCYGYGGFQGSISCWLLPTVGNPNVH